MVLMQEKNKKKKTHVFNGVLNIGEKGSTQAWFTTDTKKKEK